MDGLRKPPEVVEVAGDAAALGYVLAGIAQVPKCGRQVLVALAPRRTPQSARSIADELGIGRATVDHALIVLEFRGLVVIRGRTAVGRHSPALWVCTTAGRTIADRIARGDW